MAATADSMVAKAVIMITGSAGSDSRARRSSSMPSMLGHLEVGEQQVGLLALEQRPGRRGHPSW